MSAITENDKAPDFSLPGTGGRTFSLSDYAGKPLVLFFYPKDDTSGCTKEAVGFSEMKPHFDSLGVALLGASPDSPKSHDKFAGKHGLTVDLVSDEEKTMLSAYGVWTEKSMYGKKYMGVERTTLLIGADGTVKRAWHKVKVPGHVEQVLDAARALG